MSILKISAPASFDRSYLLLHDPAYIVDIDPSPENFCVFLDYLPENDGLWFYACNFDSSEWSEICLPSSCVRRRKVSRLLISIDDVERASFLKDSWLSRYRSIHPKFIDAALTGFEYKIEIVVEYQRFLRDRYDSCNLGYSDPAPWNFALSSSSTSDIGWGENCLADPTSCPLSSLRPLDQCSTFRLIDGWQILHDFVHILHPNRDEMGWQYSDSFANDCERTDQSATSWSRDRGTKPFPVRRRLWMRTLVKEIDLEDCRTALDTYISTHPRGVIFSSIVQRRSHYRKRWCDAIATLKDDKIEFQIKNNYQKFVSYQLHGCEPVLLSHTSEASDYLTKFSLFGLRKIGGALLPGLPVENHLDNSGGIICVLNAHSLELRDNWISVLTHQLLLVNSYRFLKHDCPQFSPPIGPPCLLDTPIILGKLWKKGKFVWKLRTFELRKSGVLAYFKRGRLIGEVRLLNEYLINVPSDTSFQYPFEIITSDGKVILELAATNDECRLRWITTIQRIIAAAWERRNSLSAAFSEGK